MPIQTLDDVIAWTHDLALGKMSALDHAALGQALLVLVTSQQQIKATAEEARRTAEAATRETQALQRLIADVQDNQDAALQSAWQHGYHTGFAEALTQEETT